MWILNNRSYWLGCQRSVFHWANGIGNKLKRYYIRSRDIGGTIGHYRWLGPYLRGLVMGKAYRLNQKVYRKEATEEFLSVLKVYRATKNAGEFMSCFQQLQSLQYHVPQDVRNLLNHKLQDVDPEDYLLRQIRLPS